VTSMEMHKLGSWITMEDGLVVDGGNKHMHGVNRGVRFNQTSSGSMSSPTSSPISMTLETLDAGVITFGTPNGFPILGLYGYGEPDLGAGASSMLFNNLWGTNYVQWYPFERKGQAVPDMENIRFRYNLKFTPAHA